MTSIITFFLSVWVYISTENTSFSQFKQHIYQLFPVWFWILLYVVLSVNLGDFENILFIILSFFGILFYIFFAPYLNNIIKNNIKQSVFYTYFYNISVLFLISFILGGVLFGLWSIWIWTVFALFDLWDIIWYNIYQDWAILALSVFTPLFALTQVPNKKSTQENHFNENAFFSFLVKYIAIPFIYVYFIILYAYTIKVLANFWDWPKWEVSWMVIGFSIFGYIIYIFSYIFEDKNKFIKVFRKAFPFVVIPQIFMLFYAIYLRISQYDITVNRYLVVVFGIWLLLISLYYVFSRKKYLSTIPFLLTVFTLVISIWPWSVHSLPESRQSQRLELFLIEANILQNGKIIPLTNYDDISKELSKEIYWWINYLCDFDNCNFIKELFPIIYKEIDEQYKKYNDRPEIYIGSREPELNRWEIVSEITKKIKVKNYHSDNRFQSKTIWLSINWSETLFPINIWEYSKILELSNNSYGKNSHHYSKINFKNKTIEIIENWLTIESFSISQILENLYSKYKSLWTTDLSKEDLIFEVISNNKTYKVLFSQISIDNPDFDWTEEFPYYYARGYILIK